MKLFIKKVLFLLVVTVSTDLYAQNGSVSGVVYGEEKPLVGANVFLEGTTMGATIGDYVIAIDRITDANDVERLNRGNMIMAWDGKTHIIKNYI